MKTEKREGATIPQSIQIDRRRGTDLWVNWGKGRCTIFYTAMASCQMHQSHTCHLVDLSKVSKL